MKRPTPRRSVVDFVTLSFLYFVVLGLIITAASVPLMGPHLIRESDRFLEELRELLLGWRGGVDLEGEVAPDFELTTLDGDSFQLSDRIGREVVIVNFFATWCAPCRLEMPELVAFHEANRGRPVFLLGVSNEARSEVEPFVGDLGVSYPIGFDGAHVSSLYAVRFHPTTVVIGADGRIAKYRVGVISDPERTFGGLVNSHLALIDSGRGISQEDYRQLNVSQSGESGPSPQPARKAVEPER